jgi:hypothetical protein
MNGYNSSPLNEACERGCEEIVDLILKWPDVDVDAGDDSFPLITAVQKQFHGIVGKLINARCDLDKVCWPQGRRGGFLQGSAGPMRVQIGHSYPVISPQKAHRYTLEAPCHIKSTVAPGEHMVPGPFHLFCSR